MLLKQLLELVTGKLAGLHEGIAHQTNLLNDKLSNIHEGIAHEASLLNDKLDNLHEGIAHQTSLLNDKLSALHEGTAHQTTLLNDKLGNIYEGVEHETRLLQEKLVDLQHQMANQTAVLSERFGEQTPRDTGMSAELLAALSDNIKFLRADVLKQLATINIRLRDLQEKANMPGFAKVLASHASQLDDQIVLNSDIARPIDVKQIPFPSVRVENNRIELSGMIADRQFQRCVEYFASEMTGEQLPTFAEEQAFLFSLIRNIRPEHIFEIGWNRGIVTEVMCRALQANGRGLLHVPGDDVPDSAFPAFDRWPKELQRLIRVHSVDEIGFLETLKTQAIMADLIVLNGSREYELPVVLETASAAIRPNGLITIINPQSAEVDNAIRNFLSRHPRWGHECNQIHFADLPNSSVRSMVVGAECAILLALNPCSSGSD